MASHTIRPSGWFFVAFAVLTVAAPLLPSHAPEPDEATDAELDAFLATDRVLQATQATLHALGALGFLVGSTMLFRGLGNAARARDPHDDGALARLGASLGVAAVTIWLVAAGVSLAALQLVGHAPARTVFVVYNAGWGLKPVAVLLLAPWLAAFAILGRRTAVVPRVVAAAAAGLAVVLLAGVVGFVVPALENVPWMTFMLFLLWCLVAGVTFAVRGESPHTNAPAP